MHRVSSHRCLRLPSFLFALRAPRGSEAAAPTPPTAECALCSVLLKNDLRGNESHGMSNMLRCVPPLRVLPPAVCAEPAAPLSPQLSQVNCCLPSGRAREYVSAYHRGIQNPTPDFKLERETPGTALIDADGALVRKS